MRVTAVRYERRLELAMEGQRFFDLRRWGIAEATLNAYLTASAVVRRRLAETTWRARQPFASPSRYFPIPAIQIELSNVTDRHGLTQNTGW